MNYDQRMMQIKQELADLLSEYAVPKNLIDPASQAKNINSTAEMINALFPNDTTPDHIKGSFKRAAMKIAGKHKSRTWPLPADISSAIQSSMQSREAAARGREDDIEAAVRFFADTQRAHPNYRSSYVAKQLIARGLLKDERDAHWRGFDMFDYKDVYTKQRMTIDEWNNHIRVLANMCNMTKEEAEDRELFGHEATLGPINQDILPEELLPRLREAGM